MFILYGDKRLLSLKLTELPAWLYLHISHFEFDNMTSNQAVLNFTNFKFAGQYGINPVLTVCYMTTNMATMRI
jgi:hypothetical protein